jgi:acyl carrier protein
MSNDLSTDIKAMIAEHFGIETGKLTGETEIASLGIDSLSMIEFMFQMEEKFSIHMADSRAPMVTVADVVAEIERAVAAQQLPQAA